MAVEMLSMHSHSVSGKGKSGLWPEWLTIGAYAAFLASMIPFHEPWADEAQAWQLARNVSVFDLFRTYLRYEGSPGLWHFLLAILGKLHVSYTGMHWVTAAIALAAVALLVLYAPFPRYIRLALPFTFYLAFQYAVIARSYSLAPLLLFAIALAWRKNPLAVALLLGLLGNVSLHALAISGGFALAYLVVNLRNRQEVSQRKLIPAALLVIAFYGFAVLTVLPKPADITFRPWPFNNDPVLIKLFAWLVRALTCAGPIIPNTFALLLLALFCWAYFAWKFQRAKILIYGLPVLTFSIFSGYYCNFWHAGLLVPTIIAICWITWPAPKTLGRFAIAFAICVIAIQIGWTIHAAAFDYGHAYSPDLAAARFLAPRVASGEPMAVTFIRNPETNAFHSIGLAPYFEQPIFLNQQRPYWLWTTHEHTETEFVKVLEEQEPTVVAIYFNDDGTRFRADRDLPNHPTATLLRNKGYGLTHAFCGEKPEAFREREEICHLIFEKKH